MPHPRKCTFDIIPDSVALGPEQPEIEPEFARFVLDGWSTCPLAATASPGARRIQGKVAPLHLPIKWESARFPHRGRIPRYHCQAGGQPWARPGHGIPIYLAILKYREISFWRNWTSSPIVVCGLIHYMAVEPGVGLTIEWPRGCFRILIS